MEYYFVNVLMLIYIFPVSIFLEEIRNCLLYFLILIKCEFNIFFSPKFITPQTIYSSSFAT